MTRVLKPTFAEDAARRAEVDFRDHHLTVLVESYAVCAYQFARPATSTFGFRVVVLPGYFALTGDIGDLVLRQPSALSPEGMIGWVAGSLDSPDYLLSKVPTDLRNGTEEWSEEIAEEEIARLRAEAEDEADRQRVEVLATEWASARSQTAEGWLEAWYDAYGDVEGCTVVRVTWQTYFQIAAIKRLIAAIKDYHEASVQEPEDGDGYLLSTALLRDVLGQIGRSVSAAGRIDGHTVLVRLGDAIRGVADGADRQAELSLWGWSRRPVPTIGEGD